ncbi:beta-1,3-galactosyltransferase 1-like [Amphiura filiformis]|uniref:beta-1,3-galactosyltransferase 1-like n=1 Tax=Amphiura filiformis TaxID=82378 RepID=UPI003B218D4E
MTRQCPCICKTYQVFCLIVFSYGIISLILQSHTFSPTAKVIPQTWQRIQYFWTATEEDPLDMDLKGSDSLMKYSKNDTFSISNATVVNSLNAEFTYTNSKPPLGLNDIATLMNYVKNDTFFNAAVVNPVTTEYVFTNSHICKRNNVSESDVFLLIAIVSAPYEVNLRETIRRTWGNITYVAGKRVAKVFLSGKSSDEKVEHKVAVENGNHHDICKHNFIDSYKNLTLKTIMGLRWATTFCKNAKYVLKIDSDTIPNLHNLVNHLTLTDQMFVEGLVFENAKVIRTARHKWYVPYDEYPYAVYPPYAGGAAYVISSNILPFIVAISPHVQLFQIEDVFLGMIYNIIGVKPK